MPTTIGAPYKTYQCVDEVPMSGSLTGSTPFWARPAFYTENHTGSAGDWANLELATGSCEYSMSSANNEQFKYNFTNLREVKFQIFSNHG